MTIASEITRLQWAKADARTSIINKWVDVPLNASVEDYHTYIDQIQSGCGSYDWINTRNFYFNNRDYSTVSWFYSREEGWVQYWLILASADTDSSAHSYSYWWVGMRHREWYDVENRNALAGNYSDNYHSYAEWSYFIQNSTDWIVRGYFYEDTRYSTNDIRVFEVIFDYRNWTCTCSEYSKWNSTDLASIVTVPAWYSVVSGNTWIKNVTHDSVDNASYFYLTLK